MSKPEMLDKLNKLGLVPNEALKKKTTLKKTNYDCSRNKPRKMIVKDLERGLETELPEVAKQRELLGYSKM